ncbi:Guanylate kinase [Bienertia sinuspersici]
MNWARTVGPDLEQSLSQITRPVAFPCLGELKEEKYVLLPSVADIVIEQGYLQSCFGVYSVRIENAGVRRPPSDDLQIQGISNPSAFRKAVLSHLSNMRTEALSRQVSATEGSPTPTAAHPQVPGNSSSRSYKHDAVTPGEFGLIQKLDEVGTSIKRVQKLIEEQHCQAQPVD